ncbi:MAG: hypothetical protein ABSG63_16215, partial [Spirochaetia bacterium]
GVRRRYLAQEKELPHTLVFYESPFRIHKLLVDALAVLGDRRAAVCVELTKQFEKVHRGTLSELSEGFKDLKVRGEITVVIAGNNPKFSAGADEQEDDDEDEPAADDGDNGETADD